MTQFRTATPVLTVRDVDASASWYNVNLGFHADLHPEIPPSAFATLSRDGVEIMLVRCGKFGMPFMWGRRDWKVYLRVDDVSEIHGHLKARLTVAGPKDKEYGCREIEISDPDGHIIVLSQRID